jgi:conserved oligomeric Golgi complex subunit 6
MSDCLLKNDSSNREITQEQLQLTNLFLQKFTLTQSEIKILTSKEVKVSEELFQIMDKCGRIKEDCRKLMVQGAESETKAG